MDDLHERAGSCDVIHLHGELNRPRCFACARIYDGANPEAIDDFGTPQEPPRCIKCGGKVRPGVVWFGESLPKDELRKTYQTAKECDLWISIGTSGVVFPAAEMPRIARRNGAQVVNINLNPTGESHDICLQGLAGEFLSRFLASAFAVF